MKIVVVEDNQTLQKSLKEVLGAQGHNVQCFSDGASAKAFMMVEHAGVDVCIVDYMLPELDGISLIKILREAGVATPMLMLTARDSVEDKVLWLESGADYYLTKPFEFAELLACLKVLYRRPDGYQEESVEIAPGLTFDMGRRVLLRGSYAAALTPTEFRILEYLVRHRGQTVPQTELYEHVFDFAKENWSNTIEVHIKNLRKKIQSENYENPIQTIRGAGYTLQ